MTKEQIKKAALQCAKDRWGDSESQHVMAKAQGTVYGFKQGAQWRINSVWHSTDELPKYSGFLAALMDNGLMETMYYSVGIGFHEMNLKGYVLWAYIDDLLPERKEDEWNGRLAK